MAKAHVYKRDHINTDEIIPTRLQRQLQQLRLYN
jgi:3-isopropylmalate dehydratase small subunit